MTLTINNLCVWNLKNESGEAKLINNLSFTIPNRTVAGLIGSNKNIMKVILQILTGEKDPNRKMSGKLIFQSDFIDLETNQTTSRKKFKLFTKKNILLTSKQIRSTNDNVRIKDYFLKVCEYIIFIIDKKEHLNIVSQLLDILQLKDIENKFIYSNGIYNLTKIEEKKMIIGIILLKFPKIILISKFLDDLDVVSKCEIYSILKNAAFTYNIIFLVYLENYPDVLINLLDILLILNQDTRVFNGSLEHFTQNLTFDEKKNLELTIMKLAKSSNPKPFSASYSDQIISKLNFNKITPVNFQNIEKLQLNQNSIILYGNEIFKIMQDQIYLAIQQKNYFLVQLIQFFILNVAICMLWWNITLSNSTGTECNYSITRQSSAFVLAIICSIMLTSFLTIKRNYRKKNELYEFKLELKAKLNFIFSTWIIDLLLYGSTYLVISIISYSLIGNDKSFQNYTKWIGGILMTIFTTWSFSSAVGSILNFSKFGNAILFTYYIFNLALSGFIISDRKLNTVFLKIVRHVAPLRLIYQALTKETIDSINTDQTIQCLQFEQYIQFDRAILYCFINGLFFKGTDLIVSLI